MRGWWPALALCFACGCVGLPVLPAELPAPEDDPLTLAAESLAKGDDPTAATHFAAYVKAHPDQFMFRLYLADLYLKLDKPAEAKPHYERFIADAQDASAPPREHLVHCHTKLMEIAQKGNDRFGESLHRGIGLVLLTREAAADAETKEEMLCQALQTLLEAQEQRPGDRRVQVYLAEAHDRAGNRRGADVARAAARNLASPETLTSAELRSIMK